MAYSAGQLAAIQEAYARGVLEARLPDGSSVKYRSLEEMERIINTISSALSVNPTYNGVVYPSHSRGHN